MCICSSGVMHSPRFPATVGAFPSRALAAALLVVAAITMSGRAAFAATARAVQPLARGVVDINTNLGYEGGSAAGTGMILTPSGEVLTNNHVIRGATAIRVTDPSTRRTYPATVVGYDPSNDVAVLTLTGASGLKPIPTGNSSTLRLGQTVTAVGNAGGVGGAPLAAAGKIVALHRSSVAVDDGGLSEQLTGLIETDAMLQPGDSGGPLLNRAGRVIGVDTAASVGSTAQQGRSVGLAIPINHALTIARQIERGLPGPTIHIGPTAFLGVDLSFQDASSGQTPRAVVAAVVPSSPAQQSGVTPGSVITALNGQPVNSYASLSTLLLRLTAGSTVTLAWTDQDGTAHTADLRTAAGPPQ